jgi:hypothetical protein
MATIIKNTEFTGIARGVKPDAKNRVVLPKVLNGKDITYHIYTNSVGQIVLDPQVTIPASELWLFENKEALSSIDRGMAESKNGQGINRGSFKKYVKDVL